MLFIQPSAITESSTHYCVHWTIPSTKTLGWLTSSLYGHCEFQKVRKLNSSNNRLVGCETGIRTQTNGVRVRCSTVKLSPNNHFVWHPRGGSNSRHLSAMETKIFHDL